MSADRLVDVGGIFRSYGELHLAVAFTDGIDGDAAKRVTRPWKTTERLNGAEAGARLAEQCERRNPAIILQASGLIGIDVDGRRGHERFREVVGRLPRTVIVESGQGWHLWFRPPAGASHHVVEFAENGVIAKSDGYLVAPPARHASGATYVFREGRGPAEIEIAELPVEALEAMLVAARKHRANRDASGPKGAHAAGMIPYHARHNVLVSLAGTMHRPGMSQQAILAALRVENELRCEPDEHGDKVPDTELETIARSAEGWDRPFLGRDQIPAGGAIEVTAAEVQAKRIRWLWRWRLAVGKLTLNDGAPDVGKTLLLTDLAARVTRGREMPDGTGGLREPRNVIVIAAFEDALDDTWVPRFVAAGGDRDRLIFLKGTMDSRGEPCPLSFPGDLRLLEARIRYHEAALVVCDAVMHLLPEGSNQNDTKAVQRGLHPHAEMLATTGAAMIANRHYTKGGGGTALDKGQGSASLIGVFRVALGMVRDSQNPNGGRLLGFSKGNIVPDSERVSLRFRIGEVSGLMIDGQPHNRVPVIEWLGSDPRSIDDELAAAAGEHESRRDAREAIIEALAGGPLPASALAKCVRDYGTGQHSFEATRAAMRKEGLIDRRQPGNPGARGGGAVEWFLTDRGRALIRSTGSHGAGAGEAKGREANEFESHAASQDGNGFAPPDSSVRGSESEEPVDDPFADIREQLREQLRPGEGLGPEGHARDIEPTVEDGVS